MIEKMKKVQAGEGGMETLTAAVLIFVVLIIAVALFLFRDAVANLINSGTGKVNDMNNSVNSKVNI